VWTFVLFGCNEEDDWFDEVKIVMLHIENLILIFGKF
jgi:hypothetical protein